jgi:RNA polymerase sigma factor for flagellar operon FliA
VSAKKKAEIERTDVEAEAAEIRLPDPAAPGGKSEEQLWKEFQKGRDPGIREYFVIKYAPLVKYVAGKVAIGMPDTIEYEDLVGYGTFGLLDAIDKFEPARNIKFKTYALTRIRGAIYDELRSIDWIPRSVRQKSREIEEVIQKLETRLGRSVEDHEIAVELGVSTDEFQKILVKISGTTLMSLNELWGSGEEDGEVDLVDTIESPRSLNPDFIVERGEIKKVIVEAIKKLPENEKKVLVLYYYEDLTLKEIGEILGVTESRVSQLHTKSILRLRGNLAQIRSSLIG